MSQKITIVKIRTLELAVTLIKNESQAPRLNLRNSRSGNDSIGLLIN